MRKRNTVKHEKMKPVCNGILPQIENVHEYIAITIDSIMPAKVET